MPVYILDQELVFPPIEESEEDGLLAIEGDLSPARLILAYQSCIFPWYSEDEPICWWSPDPRFVLFPSKIKISTSMKQCIRKGHFRVTFDTSFKEVLHACAIQKREGQDGTWITDEMVDAYLDLHSIGVAHSVEVWKENELVGGLYGVSLGTCFFGESMFSKESNASKMGFITLVQYLQARNFTLIDCQVYTPHLESLGAEMISRVEFKNLVDKGLETPSLIGRWTNWI